MADVTSADDAQADVNPQQWLDYAKSLTASIQATGKYTGPQIQDGTKLERYGDNPTRDELYALGQDALP